MKSLNGAAEEMLHLPGVGGSSDADLALLALHPLQAPVDEHSLRERDATKEHISPPDYAARKDEK